MGGREMKLGMQRQPRTVLQRREMLDTVCYRFQTSGS